MSYSNFGYKISFKTRILNIGRRVFFWQIFENWLMKRTANKPVSSFWCRFIPPEYLYPKNSYRVVRINDVTYKLDISNVVDHAAFWGFQDKATSFFLSQL